MEDYDGEFKGYCNDDSFLDSIFEEELDQLLDKDSYEHPPYLLDSSESVEGDETPHGVTEVTGTHRKDCSPAFFSRLGGRDILALPMVESSASGSSQEGGDLSETEVIKIGTSESTQNTPSPKTATQMGCRTRRPPSPRGTTRPAKSRKNVHTARSCVTESSESSKKQGKTRASPSPSWIPSPTKQKNNAHAAARRWKTDDEPDPGPKPLKFTPARTPGPQLDTTKDYTVLELFQLFFSYDVVATLCSNTNKNAEKRREQEVEETWKPVCVEEMYKYLSIIVYMGLLNVHNISDYWSQDRMYCLPFCRTVMTMTRFRALTYSLHMSDPGEDYKNEKKGQLLRIQPLKDQILESCRAHYHPYQNLSIGVRMVHSKACNGSKQDVATKRYKNGFKLYILADSQNGYTCDFSLFLDKNPSASGKGESYDAVMNLLNVTHLGSGYHLYVDNIFTSPTLFRDLYKKELGACGTMDVGFPSIQENSMPAQAKKGTVRWLRDGKLLFTKWMGAEPVTMCSTIHNASLEEKAKRRKLSSNGSYTTQSTCIPEVVACYNKHKGGVELSDNLIKCFSVAHKTMKWYRNFFFHFVDVAVVNSFLLQKEIAQKKKTPVLTHKQFREELSLQLADIGEKEEAEEEEEGYSEEHVEEVEVKLDTDQEQPVEQLVEVKQPCYPVPLIYTATADSSEKVANPRRQCCLCKEFKTHWQCESCQVALCLIPDRNCFRMWHMNKKNLVAEVFKRQIKYNPYPHPWTEYGGK